MATFGRRERNSRPPIAEIVRFVLPGFSTEVTLPLGDYEALGSPTRQEFRSFRFCSRNLDDFRYTINLPLAPNRFDSSFPWRVFQGESCNQTIAVAIILLECAQG